MVPILVLLQIQCMAKIAQKLIKLLNDQLDTIN